MAQKTNKQAGDGSTLAAVLEKKSEKIGYTVQEEERIPGSRVRFKLKINDGDFDSKLGETIKDFGRQVRLPGFRPGKAPSMLVRKSFEPQAREETVKRLVPRVTQAFAEDKGYEVISQPYLLEWKSDRAAGTSIEIALEIHPEVNATEDTLKDLAVTVHQVKIDDEYVARALENIRAENAIYEPTEEGYKPKDGLLFDCTVTGENGLVVEDRSVTNYYSQKLEEEMPENVAAALVGKKKGETVVLDLLEESELIPGKKEKVHYEVVLHEVKSRVLPALDDELAKDVSEEFETLEDLKAKIRENAIKNEENREREEALNEVFNILRDRLEFDLPRALVQNTAQQSVMDMEKRLNQYGMSLRAMDQTIVQNYAQSMHAQARVNVKNHLILRSISKLLNVQPTEEEISKALEDIAARMGRKPLAVRAQLEAKRQWEQFIQDLTLKSTNDRVLDRTKITHKAVTVEEFEAIQRKRQEEQAAKLRGEQIKAEEEEARADAALGENAELIGEPHVHDENCDHDHEH